MKSKKKDLTSSAKNGNRHKNSLLSDIKTNNFSYLIALPGIVYVLIFNYAAYPFLLLAFQRFNFQKSSLFDILFRGDWCGFDNFKFFFKSQIATRITFNTLFLNLMFMIFGTLTALIIALMINELRCKWFIRGTQSLMMFPNYLSWVMVGYILISLLSTRQGLVNRVLVFFGMEPVSWFTTPEVWPAILTVMKVWNSAGMSSIIYLAAIMGIDNSLYEAAAIDGASRWQRVTRITLPLLMPTLCILQLLGLGRVMYGDFGMIYALIGDNGVLYPTTDIIDTYLFRSMRLYSDLSQSTAIDLFRSVIGFFMVYSTNWLARKFFPDGALY